MKLENEYLISVYEMVKEQEPYKMEFLQTVKEMLMSLEPIISSNPKWIQLGILERVVEPERYVQFRVPWIDDRGIVQVNRGYRVQFNSAIGPYKGGLRFHPSVSSSVIKFLGFEQTFKNSLTQLPMGGAKGGANFDPRNKSDGEIMRFCQSFMSELCRHIGATTDIPAGDLGVGNREIGFLYGQYKRSKNHSEGAMTGKELSSGGSHLRTEATGYGICYFAEKMLNFMRNDSLCGKTIVVSGSGVVAQYVIEKAHEIGAKVIAASDSDGYIVDESGINLEVLKQIKNIQRGRIKEYAQQVKGATYTENPSGAWDIKCDIAIPCAKENEITCEDAEKLIHNGVSAVIEGSNMSSTLEAVEIIQDSGILFAPSKAANAGGVAVSGLEMTQNATFTTWSDEKVDRRLKDIMSNIFHCSYQAAEACGNRGNLLIGANIAGFSKVANAMSWQGVI